MAWNNRAAGRRVSLTGEGVCVCVCSRETLVSGGAASLGAHDEQPVFSVKRGSGHPLRTA